MVSPHLMKFHQEYENVTTIISEDFNEKRSQLNNNIEILNNNNDMSNVQGEEERKTIELEEVNQNQSKKKETIVTMESSDFEDNPLKGKV